MKIKKGWDENVAKTDMLKNSGNLTEKNVVNTGEKRADTSLHRFSRTEDED
jgi:hypothetical protein